MEIRYVVIPNLKTGDKKEVARMMLKFWTHQLRHLEEIKDELLCEGYD